MNYEITAIITASIESAAVNIKALRFTYHGLSADSFENLPFYTSLLRGFLRQHAGKVVWLKGGIIEQPAYLVFKTELSDAVVEMLSKPLKNQGIYEIEIVQNPLELIRKYVDNERVCIGLLETASLHLGNRQTLATSMPFDYQEGILLDKNTLLRAEDVTVKPARRYNHGTRAFEEVEMLIFHRVVILTLGEKGRIIGEEYHPLFGIWRDVKSLRA